MIPHDTHLQIGSLLFEGLDQIDLTGPFEVLSRIPNSTHRIYAKTPEPVRDLRGLRLTPDAVLSDAPQLDVLHVPGGFGQEALMDDAEVLGWITRQATGARSVFSVCTGALLCGAAGLLKGRRATTHWASFHLLPLFGAIPVNQRVVVDGNWVFAAGVTAGIDGALRLAAELRGDDAAKAIQLYMVYAPEPPFDSGTPETAPAAILERARRSVADITAQREATARRVAGRLGIAAPAAPLNEPRSTTTTQKENDMTTTTFTKTAPPPWLLDMWKEIDDKTFGKGFDCFAEDAICNLGVADWHGRETIRNNLRAFIDRGFTALHDVVEYWDSPSLKIFRGTVHMKFDDPKLPAVKPTMTHFFYMDKADPTKVKHWYGAVGPTGF
jgi:cyclohexyl-isocyanide hydratase